MFLETERKSRSVLTEEENEFWITIRARATSKAFGQPLISHIFYRLVPISAPGLKTMAIDKHFRVYIDFEYMKKMGIEFATQVLNHEPWHPMRKHSNRAEDIGNDIDHDAWNLAADAEINDDIRERIPENSIFPQTFDAEDDETAEYYYAKIVTAREAEKNEQEKNQQPEEQNKPEKSGDKDKGDEEDNDDSGDSDKSDELGDKESDEPGNTPGDMDSEESNKKGDPSEQKGNGKGDPSDEQGSGDPSEDTSDSEGGSDASEEKGSGSGSGNSAGEGEGKEPGSGSGQGNPNSNNGKGQSSSEQGELSTLPTNEVCSTDQEKIKEYLLDEDEAEAVSDFDQNIVLSEIAQKVRDETARNPGNVPNHMKLWADQFFKPTKTPWQKILRPAVRSVIEWTKKSKMDYHKQTPNRRQPIEGIRLPALRAPNPRMIVGVDTSGSHVPLLPRVSDELYTIIKSSGVKGKNLKMISIDTHIKDKPTIVNSIKDVKFTGGGGTSMLPFFDLTVKIKKDVDIALLLTDGEVPPGSRGWYPEKPTNGIQYIVCILGFEGDKEFEKSFIRAEKEMPWAKIVQIEVPKEEINF
jgi:predicted metal-dependent peptidase